MSRTIPGQTWIEDHTGDVIEAAWASTNHTAVTRTPRDGRIFQAEESGELRGWLAKLLAAAQEIVLISSFLFADPDTERALLDAAKRGVRVYMLVASEARLEKEVNADDTSGQKILEDHKRLLDELAGWVYVRSAEHFHAKFVLVDPLTQPRGMLLTANLTKEALVRNHELGVYLRATEVQALAALFTWAFWESAQKELLKPGRLKPVEAAGRFPIPGHGGGIVTTAGDRRDLRAAVLELIRSARRTLVVATFGIGDEEVLTALEERARNGISVTLLVRHPRVALLDTLRRLARAGIHVHGVSAYLHAKAILVDGMKGLMMTANLESHGLDQGFEMGVELAGEDAAALDRVLGAWRAGAEWYLAENARLDQLRGVIQVLNGKGYKELVVEPLGRVDDGQSPVDSCTKIAEAPRPRPTRMPDGKLFHRIEHAWSIALPMLARGAKPWSPSKDKEEPPPPFPIFDEPGGRRVFVIDQLAQVSAAAQAMQAWGVRAVVLRGER